MTFKQEKIMDRKDPVVAALLDEIERLNLRIKDLQASHASLMVMYRGAMKTLSSECDSDRNYKNLLNAALTKNINLKGAIKELTEALEAYKNGQRKPLTSLPNTSLSEEENKSNG